MTRSVSLAGAMALVVTPAVAQDTARPSFWDVLTFEYVATALMHNAVNWARLLADIRYEQLSADPLAMRVVLTGAEILPLIPDLPDGACRVAADRITLSGGPIDRIGTGRGRLTLDGMSVSSGCLPVESATMLRAMGFPELHFKWTEIDFRYDHASGGGQFLVTADLDRMAQINLTADLDYISFRMDFETEEPVVALDLNHLEIGLRDLGGWALARNFLPPELTAPGALGPVVAGGLMESLAEANGPDTPLTDTQRAFAVQAGEVLGGFTDGGKVIVSTTIPDRPLRISETSVEPFAQFFDRLAPTLGTTSPAVLAALPTADLQATLDAPEPPADGFEAGRALLTGIGAPRNVAQGLRLLLPLARAGNTDASLLMAQALADRHPVDAYSHALRAASANLPGALALLDRVERALSYEEALQEQNAMVGGPEDLYGDLDAMRLAARQFLTGVDRPRSWRAAYYWASMAAAAGDASSAAIRDDIDEMMRLRGDQEAWRKEAESLENGVLRDWIAKDVPALLR